MGMLTSVEEKQFQEWMEREGLTQQRAAAKKKNGRWRNFWTEYGAALLYWGCAIALIAVAVAVYFGLEDFGWFRL